jgi:glutamyl-tRNA reductase
MIYPSMNNKFNDIFYVVGISHKQASVDFRESFSLNNNQCEELLLEAKSMGIEGLVVLSTCNRAEIYGLGNSSELVIHLLLKHSKGTLDVLEQFGYKYSGKEMIWHLFHVASGLDSMILGENQILGQVREAFKRSQKTQMLTPVFAKLFETVFSTVRQIKNQTLLSSGVISIASVVQKIIENNINQDYIPKILIYGVGKTGKSCLQNLKNSKSAMDISLINRDSQKAEMTALEYNVSWSPFHLLNSAIEQNDIIIVATTAGHFTLVPDNFKNAKKFPSLILDLSVPRNVDPEIETALNLKLVDIDQISNMLDDTVQIRQSSIQKANTIIRQNIDNYKSWYELRKCSPALTNFHERLYQIKNDKILMNLNSENIETDNSANSGIKDPFIENIVHSFADYARKNPGIKLTPIQILNEVFQLDRHK